MSITDVKIENIQALHYYFNEVYSTEDSSPLHIFVTSPKISLSEISEYAQSRDRRFRYTTIDEDFYSIELRMKKRGVRGWLFTREDVWLFYISSDFASAQAAEVTEVWIKGMFPFISLGRIAPPNIYDILDSLRDSCLKLRINDYLSKQYLSISKWASQKNWSGVEYTREYLERKVTDDGNIIDSVRIEFIDDKQSFKAGLSKNGHITYYAGAKRGYTTFYRLLVDTYIDKALTRLRSLENKEARISSKVDNAIYPIAFKLKEGNFTISLFEKMVEAVKEQSDYSVSVLHKGNPWLSLSVVDRSDGSNTHIYGFDDRLEMIPMLKASPESLARLEDLIYEVFTSVIKTST